MLAQAARQEPAGYGEIRIVRAGEAGAIFLGSGERGSGGWDGVVGQAAPAESGGRVGGCIHFNSLNALERRENSCSRVGSAPSLQGSFDCVTGSRSQISYFAQDDK